MVHAENGDLIEYN